MWVWGICGIVHCNLGLLLLRNKQNWMENTRAWQAGSPVQNDPKAASQLVSQLEENCLKNMLWICMHDIAWLGLLTRFFGFGALRSFASALKTSGAACRRKAPLDPSYRVYRAYRVYHRCYTFLCHYVYEVALASTAAALFSVLFQRKHCRSSFTISQCVRGMALILLRVST